MKVSAMNLKLLRALKKRIKETSMNRVKTDLSLGSRNTVAYWIDTKKIPVVRHEAMKTYLKDYLV